MESCWLWKMLIKPPFYDEIFTAAAKLKVCDQTEVDTQTELCMEGVNNIFF